MPSELVPGTNNVFRFPIERRAKVTIDLLRDMAPDIRMVLIQAKAFGLDTPDHALRDRTDWETVGYIGLQIPTNGHGRLSMLRELEEKVLGPAVGSAWAALDAADAAHMAQATLDAAEAHASQYWLDGLRQRAESAAEHAAMLALMAHARAEEAEGVTRAVGFALRREIWHPRDHEADADVLIAIGAALA